MIQPKSEWLPTWAVKFDTLLLWQWPSPQNQSPGSSTFNDWNWCITKWKDNRKIRNNICLTDFIRWFVLYYLLKKSANVSLWVKPCFLALTISIIPLYFICLWTKSSSHSMACLVTFGFRHLMKWGTPSRVTLINCSLKALYYTVLETRMHKSTEQSFIPQPTSI